MKGCREGTYKAWRCMVRQRWGMDEPREAVKGTEGPSKKTWMVEKCGGRIA